MPYCQPLGRPPFRPTAARESAAEEPWGASVIVFSSPASRRERRTFSAAGVDLSATSSMASSRSTSVGRRSRSSQMVIGTGVSGAVSPPFFVSLIDTAETCSVPAWCQSRCSAGSKPRLYATSSYTPAGADERTKVPSVAVRTRASELSPRLSTMTSTPETGVSR